MTNRERIANILNYRPADRMPAVHFGYWEELIDEWIEQGVVSKDLWNARYDNCAEAHALDELLGWDFNWQSMVVGINGLNPYFEYRELNRDAEGFVEYQSPFGLIERKREGAAGIPGEVDYLLKDRKAYEELFKPKLQFTPDRVDETFIKNYVKDDRENPLALHLGSVFGSVRDMLSVLGMSYMMCDDYELLEEIVDDYAELQYRCTEAVLKTGVKFDYAHFWEDICFKNGPLLSPVMFDELCAKHYKKRTDLVKRYGIDIISLDCDGVIESLVPTWFANGVNTLFPLEVGVWGDQFPALRSKFGRGLRGVGSMDKTAFRKDRTAVDAELERLQKTVLAGGYIPCPDHRIMPGSKFELVKYYAERVKEIKLYRE